MSEGIINEGYDPADYEKRLLGDEPAGKNDFAKESQPVGKIEIPNNSGPKIVEKGSLSERLAQIEKKKQEEQARAKAHQDAVDQYGRTA